MRENHDAITHSMRPTALRDKIAQLLTVRIGSNLPPTRSASEDEERVAELINQCPIGGLVLFNGVWPELGGTLARLQEKSRWPLLVTSDLERGAGQQIRGLTRFPHAAAFGTGDTDAAEAVAAMAQITGQQALAAGAHANLSPVADINSNPSNPIIATRAYGDSPAAATPLLQSFLSGTASAGALSCAKHFPGHGDTHQDSHATLPIVEKTRAELDQIELAPFRAAITAGVPMVMTAHVAYPALDPSGDPATVSQPILRGLLRDELGFTGVVCSDSLLMAGLRDRFDSEGLAIVAAIRAGVDLQLDVDDPLAAVDAVSAAVEAGELAEHLIDEAFDRIWRMKSDAIDRQTASEQDPLKHEEVASQLAKRVAEKAIQWTLPTGKTAPRLHTGKPAIALLRGQRLPTDPRIPPLLARIREHLPDAKCFELCPDSSEEEFATALEALKSAEQALLALVVKPAAWQAFGLGEQHRALVAKVVAEVDDPIIASLGSPVVLTDFPDHLAKVCTLSDEAVSQRALADSLLA